MNNTLNTLPQIEQQLATALNTAADLIDTVGKHRLEQATLHFQTAVVGAQNRLLDVKSQATLAVQHLADVMADMSRDFQDMVGFYDRPQLEVVKILPYQPDEMIDLGQEPYETPNYPPLPEQDEVVDLAANGSVEEEKPTKKKSKKK